MKIVIGAQQIRTILPKAVTQHPGREGGRRRRSAAGGSSKAVSLLSVLGQSSEPSGASSPLPRGHSGDKGAGIQERGFSARD